MWFWKFLLFLDNNEEGAVKIGKWTELWVSKQWESEVIDDFDFIFADDEDDDDVEDIDK